MSANNGWSGANNPSFLKPTSGMAGSGLGTPLSSSSRISNRFRTGLPPQYSASYFAKYQPQLGTRFSGMCIDVPSFWPQSSKATCRTAFGVLLSIVSTLGRPVGTGNGPRGRSMATESPSTMIVARGNGYKSPAVGSQVPSLKPGEQGSGKSKL